VYKRQPVYGRRLTGQPAMFRVMRLYWRSMRKIGWLTKRSKNGTLEVQDWVDENYKVTEEPVYDTSVIKEKTKDNLIYGEHIDWTWAPEWRHVMKISPNRAHPFWLTTSNFDPIYVDGAPVKFQFKGKNDPFNSLPPVEGCYFSYINTSPHSFIDRIYPLQVLYNIVMNKIPKKILEDYGNKIAVPSATIHSVNMSNNATDTDLDPYEEFEKKLETSKILEIKTDRETIREFGNSPAPQVLRLSTIEEASFYFTLAQNIKWEAGELLGISRQRLGQMKASETKYGIQQSLNYSEVQTEKYFEQHTNLMQRVRQRMLEATQYYSTFSDVNRLIYQTDMNENIFLEVEGMDNLLRHYNINIVSRSDTRELLNRVIEFLMRDNTLPIKYSTKVEALIQNSLPNIINIMRKGEYELEQRQREAQERQYELQKMKIESDERIQKEKMERDDRNEELNRQKDIEVAYIRSASSDSKPVEIPQDNTQEKMANYLKMKELQESRQRHDENMSQRRQEKFDEMLLKRDELKAKYDIARLKAESAEKVAKMNKNKYDVKSKE